MRASTTIIMLSSLSCAFAAPIGVGEISATVGSLVDDAPDAVSPGAGDPDLLAVASVLVPGVLYTDAAVTTNMCGLLNSVLELLSLEAFDCDRLPTYAAPATSECEADAPPTLHAVAPEDDSGDDSGSGDDGGDSWDDGGDSDDGSDDSGDDDDESSGEDDVDLGGLGLDDGGDDDSAGEDDTGDDNEDDGNWNDCECDEDEDDGSGADDADLELPTETWAPAEPVETAAPEQDLGDDDLAPPPVLHAVAPASVDDNDDDELASGGGSLLPCLDPCVSGVLDHLAVGDLLGGDSPVGSLVHVAAGNVLGGNDSPVSNLVHVAVGKGGDGLLGGGNGLLGGGGGGGLLGGLL